MSLIPRDQAKGGAFRGLTQEVADANLTALLRAVDETLLKSQQALASALTAQEAAQEALALFTVSEGQTLQQHISEDNPHGTTLDNVAAAGGVTSQDVEFLGDIVIAGTAQNLTFFDGTPVAKQTVADPAAVTSAPAAGDPPTKAEFDLAVADIAALRAALLAVTDALQAYNLA
jgi:hypothetical protein